MKDFYLREEYDGISSIASHSGIAPENLYFLNRTATEILKASDGTLSAEDMAAELHRLYPAEKYDELLKDVKDTLYFLGDLGVMELQGDDRAETTGLNIRLAEDKDVRAIAECVETWAEADEEDGVSFYAPYGDLEFIYSPRATRSRMVRFQEIFFLMENDGKIVGLISLYLPVTPVSAAVIGILGMNAEGEQLSALDEIFAFIVERMEPLEVLKLRSHLISDFDSNFPSEFIEYHDFFLEATLKDEFGEGVNLEMWTYRPAVT